MSDTVDDNNEPDGIGGCAIACRVYNKEGCGRNFIHFGADGFSKDFGLKISGGNIKINSIGY